MKPSDPDALDWLDRDDQFPCWPAEPDRGSPALIVEREADARLAHCLFGSGLNVLAAGVDPLLPPPLTVTYLAFCPVWLIGTDHDDAGDTSASRFRSLAPAKARRLFLPDGYRHLGEFARSGGDVRGWMAAELARLGLPAVAGPTRNLPRPTMHQPRPF